MLGLKRMSKNGSYNHLFFPLTFIIQFLTFTRVCFRYIALLVISIGCYLAAFTLSGILFIWFNPSGHDCGLNVFFIVMTMILCFSFGVIALHPKVHTSPNLVSSLHVFKVTCMLYLSIIFSLFLTKDSSFFLDLFSNYFCTTTF